MSQGAAHVRPAGEAVEPGAIIAGKYTILRRLSGGPPGAWLSRSDDRGEALVALHVLCPPRPETLARGFEQELNKVAKLAHPQLVPISDFGRCGERFYVAHAALELPNLNQLIENDWPLPEPRIVQLLLQLLAALEVAHDAGLAHGDLQPGNLLLRPGADESTLEELVLCGLGLARYAPFEVPPAGSKPLLQLAPHLLGTPEYAAPEQLRGEAHDARSDLYGVGTLLFQLLTRRPPFLGETAHEVAWKQCFTPPAPPSGYTAVSSPLEAVCLKALSKTPEIRYQSAAEMRAALLAALQTPSRRPTRRPIRRKSQVPQVVVSQAVPMQPARDEACASHSITLAVRSQGAQVLPTWASHAPVNTVSLEAPPSVPSKRSHGSGFKWLIGGCLIGALSASAAPHVDRVLPWLDSVLGLELAGDGEYADDYDEPSDFFAAELEPQATARDQRQILIAKVAAAMPSEVNPVAPALEAPAPAAIQPSATRPAVPSASAAAVAAPSSAAAVLPRPAARPRRSPEPQRAEAEATPSADPTNPPQLSIERLPDDSTRLEATRLAAGAGLPASGATVTPDAADAPPALAAALTGSEPQSTASDLTPSAAAKAAPPKAAEPAPVLREPPPASFASPTASERARVAFGEVSTAQGAASKASLHAALNKAAITDCYRSVVRIGQAPASPIHTELAYETNENGRIVEASLRGINLPSELERCVEDVARLGRVREADTGRIQAAVSVSFLPE